MRKIKLEILFPMLMFRDLNKILGMHEKNKGVMQSERQINAFRDIIDACECCDLSYKENTFT